MLRKNSNETDTRTYVSLYDQLPRNVHKCTFPMTNDFYQQEDFIKMAVHSLLCISISELCSTVHENFISQH